MSDITMCKGGTCPVKETCYRFLATESLYRQSFFVEIPFNFDRNYCDNFVPAKEEQK